VVVTILLDTVEETFTHLVGSAMEDKVISPLAEGYVVEVLCTCVTAPNADPRSLRLEDLLRLGLDAEGHIRREYLRVTGDLALFVSGIFPDSFNARTKKTAYTMGNYIDIGRAAYDNIESEVFEELADNFPQIVDSLNDVSVRLRLTGHDIQGYIDRRRLIDARTTRR
jgi:hypothetical protein